MKYKAKVLKRFPTAEIFVADRWIDGTPRRVSVRVPTADIGHTILDIGGTHAQGAAAAWRNAYYWCVRNPAW